MCPVCLTTTALAVTGAISAGGLTALVIELLRGSAHLRKTDTPTRATGAGN